MQDVSVILENRPGALAEFGEALARAGVSLDGGGVFVHGTEGIAHFLVDDGAAAREALEEVGIRVECVSDVVTLRLRQDVPGQLGSICRRLADAGVNIEVQYSDHDHRLVLVVDDVDAARRIADGWSGEATG